MSTPILIEARYRSGLERKIAKQLEEAGVRFGYETVKVPYVVPERKAKYTPDFQCGEMLLESKGYFRTTAERQKLLHVRESNPHLDIRLVFQDARKPIYKGSKTTYAKWAEDHGFQYATGGAVPACWIKEMKTRRVNDKSGKRSEPQASGAKGTRPSA